MKLDIVFSYSWFIDDKEEHTAIRLYGLGDNNENICLRIDDFQPYVYVELPDDISWDASKAQKVVDKIEYLIEGEEDWKKKYNNRKKPLTKSFQKKYKLYGAHFDTENKRKLFPYLKFTFANIKHIKNFIWLVKNPIQVFGIGLVKLRVHEQDASPILQLVSNLDIPTAGWIVFKGQEVDDDAKVTYCEKEYIVSWKAMTSFKPEMNLKFPCKRAQTGIVADPLIMAFDLEVNSTNPSAMPDAKKPGDRIFQISCVFSRDSDTEDKYIYYLLTLGDPNPIDNTNILSYRTEGDLIEGFATLVTTLNPNVIIGYNIFTFDIPYLINRAKDPCMCFSDLDRIGFHQTNHSKEITIKWSSSAFKDQEFQFLDAEGRLFVDLLPLIKRDFKFNNYKLDTVAKEILKEGKHDLNAKAIFKCYKIGMQKDKAGVYTNKARKAMALVGKYCIQDSALLLRLMSKMKLWIGLTEQATTFNCSIFSIYTAGQQIKVYSQLYAFCLRHNFVVEKDGYIASEDEKYTGAHVFDPVVGMHDNVICLDFSSLYPSSIIAYNIDYATLVQNDLIPDTQCNVMIWDDHVNCEHDPKVMRKAELTEYINSQKEIQKKLRDRRDKTKDKILKQQYKDELEKNIEALKPYTEERSGILIGKNVICGERKYRFLKEPVGVLPTVLKDMLDARKKTRSQIKKIKCGNEVCKEPATHGITEPKFCILHKAESYNELVNKEKAKDLKVLLDVLDKRQLAYKVACNSAYGAMGVRRGYLPFMAGAMCTTFMGRKNIQIVAEEIQHKYGGHLVYGDSVTGDTPILIRYPNKMIDIKTIETLSSSWTEYEGFKAGESNRREKQQTLTELEAWTSSGWAKINRVIRHKTKKSMFRINTHTGCVDVTEDHSLLDENKTKVKPTEVEVGFKLLHHFPVEFNSDYVLSEKEAFVWGFFFADGSCGDYLCPSGRKRSWAINNSNLSYLNKAQTYLEEVETAFEFKILDTLKSSGVYKLVATGSVKDLVEKYRQLFYDKDKYKVVPKEVLNSNFETRKAFFEGYYMGDGWKIEEGVIVPEKSRITMNCKGKIGTQGLYYLVKSLGYKYVSICIRNDKPNIYKIDIARTGFRKEANAIKKIVELPSVNDDTFVYDIETEDGTFGGGVGSIILKNTDSNLLTFPEKKTPQELWDYSGFVADEISKLFPPPMKLEFEDAIYKNYLIFTKKRYMYSICDRDGNVQMNKDQIKIGKKGILLARRDNALFIRNLYQAIVNMIFTHTSSKDVFYFILTELNRMFSRSVPASDFVITQSVGNVNNMEIEYKTENKVLKAYIGSYKTKALPQDEELKAEALRLKQAVNETDYYEKCLPAVVQLAQKMRRRGQRVDVGSRLEYVVIDNGNSKDKKYNKIESIEYLVNHGDVLCIDYLWYLKAMIDPLDQLLNTWLSIPKLDFFAKQYKHRENFVKVKSELISYFYPKLLFEK